MVVHGSMHAQDESYRIAARSVSVRIYAYTMHTGIEKRSFICLWHDCGLSLSVSADFEGIFILHDLVIVSRVSHFGILDISADQRSRVPTQTPAFRLGQ